MGELIGTGGRVAEPRTSILGTPRTPSTWPDEEWAQDAGRRFEARLLSVDRPFPCVFGVDAVRKGTLRYAFVGRGVDRISDLVRALHAFTSIADSLGPRTSLVALFEPDGTLRDLPGWRAEFWALLQDLHAHDSSPWPPEISRDTEAPRWEYAFAGVPYFIVANAPTYEKRLSRQFDYFAVTFQPRFVFDGLVPGSRAGENARRVVRARLASYDTVPPTLELGAFGTTGNREWTQYFLEDEDTGAITPSTARCPFLMTAEPRLRPVEHQIRPEVVTMSPTIKTHDLAEPGALYHLLPEQGSIELQRDAAGKIHDWHYHSVDEELYLLEGELELSWIQDDQRRDHCCRGGSMVHLPAGTVHRSQAGRGQCVYIIRPLGAGPVTTRLSSEDNPFLLAQRAARVAPPGPS